MKKVFLTVIAFSIFIAGYLLYIGNWSTDAKRGKQNISNAKKVRPNMSIDSVFMIMGNPDTVIQNRACYETNNDSYPYVQFSFDSLNRVTNIYSPNHPK